MRHNKAAKAGATVTFGHTPEVGNSTANRDSYQLYLHEFLTIQIVALKKVTTLFHVGTMN